ncbi:MAG: crotonase/enoyl-CoA hydratase family protein [Bacteroidota bacterium]
MAYQTFLLDIDNHIAHVRFNRPEKANSLNKVAWDELKAIFEELDENQEVRVVILSGEGKHFCAGIDLEMLMGINQFNGIKEEGRKREYLRGTILYLQDTVSAIEKCRKPVLAAIHKACVGGGMDITTACDMRYCTEDAFFSVKEIDMGMVADLGTLQRLPTVIGEGMAREMAYTGRRVFGAEAREIGLVNRVYPDQEAMLVGVKEMAAMIASKSPLSIRGTKEMLLYTRDHNTRDSLDHIATWNAGMLLSEDLMKAFQAKMTKTDPVFQD